MLKVTISETEDEFSITEWDGSKLVVDTSSNENLLINTSTNAMQAVTVDAVAAQELVRVIEKWLYTE